MAAGLGFKTFTTGEVLTAADVNGYLMQGILVFANATARSSAITSPQEGQYSFLKDTNALEYYDGAAWVGAPVGDITAVNAGTGITGGGASGSVTITNDMATTITAAGDLVVGTGNATYDNLPIGTTGQVLTADTTVSPYKVKWAAAAAGGKVLQVVQATTSSATVISSTTYTDTGVTASITPSATSSNVLVIVSVQFQIQSDQSSGYGAGTKLLRGATTILDNSSSSIGAFMLEAGNSPNGRIGKRGYYTQAYLDSPSTTSSTTYKVQAAANTTAGTSFFQAQGNSCVSSIILMEIGA